MADRWSAVAEWVQSLKQQGFHLDANTAVIIDIDKTTIGARGRNDKVIDRARLAGIYRTMDSVLGADFDQALYEQHYNGLNRAAISPADRRQSGLPRLHLHGAQHAPAQPRRGGPRGGQQEPGASSSSSSAGWTAA